jgi:actin-like ATPase involved in cell morphogenesis
MMEPFIGIDFGTCNSSAAWFNPRAGQAEPLLNAEGEDKTPSVVYFGPSDTVVGRHAEERLESPEERARVLSAVKRDLAKPRVWVVGERRVTPLEAATLVLAKIKRDAEETHFHEPVARAVITCPAVFDEAEKDKLREAASLAGFREVELLEEPVAAAVAYAEAGVKVGRYVLVYDLGGGTFDLALLVREEDDTFRLAMEPRGERVGGEDFDRAIYEYFEARLRKLRDQPICPDGLDLHLLRQCRRFKESLTTSTQAAPVSWHWPGNGRVELKLNRERLESLVEKHVERTVRLTRSIREEAAAAGYTVDSVILIGGSSRMPCIIRRLQDTLQVEPRKWHKQDVAVALGAAYYGQRLWGKPSTVTPPPSAARQAASAEREAPSAPQSALHSDEAQGLYVRARQRFDEAITSPVDGRQQHLDAALQYAQAACDLDAHWAEPFQLKGRILQEKGEWLLAAAAYTVCLRLDPSAAGAYHYRGFCKFMAADYGGARKDFDEVIRLATTELAHRYRAACHLRLGDAAAAVVDIQSGLALANQDTPRAALQAACGLLQRDELRLARESIASFAEGLHLLEDPAAQDKQFVEIGILFDLAKRMDVGLAASAMRNKPGVASATLKGIIGRLAGKAISDASPRTPIAWLQQALWQACKTVHGSCTREAVSEFMSRNCREIDDRLWKEEPAFALHAASLCAEKQNSARTLAWLKNLLAAQPSFDIRRVRGDFCIAKLPNPELTDFLTPRWTFQEQHRQVFMFNFLTVTNLSAFRLTNLQVRVQASRRDGTRGEAKVLELASLDAGASQRWPGIFEAGGWFGGNIAGVRVTLTCAEGEAKLVKNTSVSDSAKDEPNTLAEDDIPEVVLLNDDPAPRPAPASRLPEDDIPEVVLLDDDPAQRPKLPKDDIPEAVLVDDEDPEKRPAPKRKPPARRRTGGSPS